MDKCRSFSHPGNRERAGQQPYEFYFLLPLTGQQVFSCDEPLCGGYDKCQIEQENSLPSG